MKNSTIFKISIIKNMLQCFKCKNMSNFLLNLDLCIKV